jgi:uncharacterized OB-fold protein
LATSTPIAEGLWTQNSADEISLLGGRCGACDSVHFPVRHTCGHCQSADITVESLPRIGKVWTWTTQAFQPKAPYDGPESESDFEGFVVGYVDLDGVCKVQTRLDVPTADAGTLVSIGTEVEAVSVPFGTDPEGNARSTYAFRPLSRPTTTLEGTHE